MCGTCRQEQNTPLSEDVSESLLPTENLCNLGSGTRLLPLKFCALSSTMVTGVEAGQLATMVAFMAADCSVGADSDDGSQPSMDSSVELVTSSKSLKPRAQG